MRSLRDICRLCGLPPDHVHVSENIVASLNYFRRPPKHLKLRRIHNIDWGVPAINYNGRWYAVPVSMIEQVWPLVKDHITRLARIHPQQQQHQDQDVEEQPDG